MINSGLNGPHALNETTLDAAVKGIGPGAYALGSPNQAGGLFISYVGRSDGDLAARLRQHIGKYPSFKYAFYSTPNAAFLKECELFHAFGALSLDNQIHPDRPQNSNLVCPHCTLLR